MGNLDRCKHCGGKADALEFQEQLRYCVICKSCGLQVVKATKEDAIAAWNRRAEPTFAEVLRQSRRMCYKIRNGREFCRVDCEPFDDGFCTKDMRNDGYLEYLTAWADKNPEGIDDA